MANRHAFTTSVEVSPLAAAGHVKTGAELMAENPYRPWPARITSIMELTATEKLFEFRLIDERIREAFHQQPGQFVELSIFGVGEAPISISSSPSKPFEHLEVDADNTFGALCGPPVMYRFVVEEMRKKGIPYDRIYMSFERHMKCGMGKCGHCQVGHQYVCIDGPVFNYWEAKNIQGSM